MVSKYIEEKISGLILADPVVINYHYQYLTKYLSPFGYDSSTLKLTKQALRKRDRWDSFETVLKSYTNRGIFTTWKAGFLKDYLLGGTKKDKNGVYLSCNPKIEAASFKNTEIVATPKIIKGTRVPIVLLIAEIGSTTAALNSFKRLVNLKKFEVIERGTHFFPMEQPDKLISFIKGFKYHS
jgi:pimeloyl-ACP methyl ester carboxylesterase